MQSVTSLLHYHTICFIYRYARPFNLLLFFAKLLKKPVFQPLLWFLPKFYEIIGRCTHVPVIIEGLNSTSFQICKLTIGNHACLSVQLLLSVISFKIGTKYLRFGSESHCYPYTLCFCCAMLSIHSFFPVSLA